jgi:CRP/FNR family transcriptional regulator, cyclic AMP receptor protein
MTSGAKRGHREPRNHSKHFITAGIFSMENPIWSYFFRPPQQKQAIIDLLRALPVFEGLSTNELVQVERVLHERRYNADEIVFNEGEPGAGMYIVNKGEIAIVKSIENGKTIQLALIPQRSFFGEIALLDEIPRSASARATTETLLFGFSKPDLESIIDRNYRLGFKIISNLSRLVCRRLIKANENTEQLQNQLNALNHPVSA